MQDFLFLVFIRNFFMNISDIKNGDSFLIKSNSFLSKTICAVMKHWGKKKDYDISILFSHAARFIWIADELYIFGSVDNGYKPLLFKLHCNWNADDFAIMRRRTPLTKAEENQTINYVLHLDTLSIAYQYWNFVQWLLLVYLNINTFKRESDKFNYCFESERKARKNLNPDQYGSVAETDIFDLLYDKNYEIIYKSKQ
jgi:hypothetical protein